MKKTISLLALALIIVLSGCQKPKITCKITAPYDGQSVLITKKLVVKVDVETIKCTVTNVVVSYHNPNDYHVIYADTLSTAPYQITIPFEKLQLGKFNITAVATSSESAQAESTVIVNVVEDLGYNTESPDFVTFTDGKFPDSWITYSWETVTTLGYDDTFSLKSANYPTATVYTNKTMHAKAYVQFYTQGENIDLYIDDEKAKALSMSSAGTWNKWIYAVDSGKHAFKWQADGALKYLDAIKFYY
ncbi:MAG: hypothetical protein FWC10_07385 [Lentimicrobiaceae bacterium]|nr:hypothetical protein [Lentimicrobiaceae bacterium]